MKNNQYSGFEVAVVGMSMRTSGATNWRAFWQNLISSKESFRFLTEEELLELGMDKSFIRDKNYVNCTTDIKDKDAFDSKFFGYSNDEAKMMFPGHRFFHECVWEALEDAGYVPENIKEPVGIYAGAGEDIIWKSFVNLSPDGQKVNNFFLNTINNKDYLPTLVSYKLGLQGPSMAIYTACSTSLVAIHTACKALIFGETKMALAGASSLVNGSQKGYIYEEGSIVSKDGHCKAFDMDSTGTVNGEGTGVVVLKRLKDALEDKDNIYAIIKGSAINNDGNKKVGFTAPSIEGQVTCIKTAQKFSKVSPETIVYVEAHGTGTKLGDSIEVEALNIAFNRNKDFSCPIGSVKTNIGHLDTASGVAGFIKTVLSLKHKQIPASLHFNEADQNINFKDGPFYVNKSLSSLQAIPDVPLRAAVNSFGIGGTNAHVIIEEAPLIQRDERKSAEANFKLLSLSAKTDTSLINYVDKLEKFLLEEEANLNLSDMCYTYQTGRQHFDKRISLAFRNKEELLLKLQELKTKKTTEKVKNTNATVVFAFPGQGSQYLHMGKDLYQSSVVFKDSMDHGFDLLYKFTNQDFKKVLYPETAEESSNVNKTSYTQPLLFLIEYSLAKLLLSYDIIPTYMIGHSIGEYTAACISGLFTFEQALKLVIKRGELMNGLPSGSMISVPVDEVQAQQFLNKDISLAAVNGPTQVVFSGTEPAIEKLITLLMEKDIPSIKLHTSHAFHSAMQDSILEEFKKEFRDVEFGEMKIPFISNVSGDFIKQEEAVSPEYWAKQLRSTVKFSKGVSNFLSDSNVVFIEVGPGKALTSLLKQHPAKTVVKQASILRGIKIQENDEKFFLENLGLLWTYGLKIKWDTLYNLEERRRISLPTYAFDNTRFQAEIDHNKLFSNTNLVSLNNLENSFYFPSWKRAKLSLRNEKVEKTFLVFSDDTKYSKEIIEKIKAENKDHAVVEVLTGKSYFKHSASKYSIDPLLTANYAELFQDIETQTIVITDVIYLWGLTINSEAVELVEGNLEFNLIYLCLPKIIKAWKKEKDKTIFVFTNLLHSVLGNEPINSNYALLMGLLKVMPLENQIIGINLDIELDSWNKQLVENVVFEILNHELESDRIISYRFGQRWVQEFQSSIQKLDKKQPSAIRKGGTYLITGGLGKLGFALSKHLLSTYQVNLILTGRRDIKDSTVVARYNELKKMNSAITYVSTDIADSKAVHAMLSKNKELFKNMNGVIHLAKGDDTDLTFLENLSATQSIKMLAPKVNGIQYLFNAFKSINLDFIWMTSSLSATYGTMGLSTYISSNIYLEYFALNNPAYLKCVELPAINFDETTRGARQNNVSVSEVIEIFEKSLTIQNAPLIYISKEDINQTLKIFNKESSTLYQNNNKSSREKSERPDLGTEYMTAQTDIEKRIKAVFEDFFEMNDIGIHDDFFELGGDSLRAMVFLKKISNEFNIDISISDFFLNKTIQGVANLIDERKWLSSEIETKNELTI